MDSIHGVDFLISWNNHMTSSLARSKQATVTVRWKPTICFLVEGIIFIFSDVASHTRSEEFFLDDGCKCFFSLFSAFIFFSFLFKVEVKFVFNILKKYVLNIHSHDDDVTEREFSTSLAFITHPRVLQLKLNGSKAQFNQSHKGLLFSDLSTPPAICPFVVVLALYHNLSEPFFTLSFSSSPNSPFWLSCVILKFLWTTLDRESACTFNPHGYIKLIIIKKREKLYKYKLKTENELSNFFYLVFLVFNKFVSGVRSLELYLFVLLSLDSRTTYNALARFASLFLSSTRNYIGDVCLLISNNLEKLSSLWLLLPLSTCSIVNQGTVHKKCNSQETWTLW